MPTQPRVPEAQHGLVTAPAAHPAGPFGIMPTMMPGFNANMSSAMPHQPQVMAPALSPTMSQHMPHPMVHPMAPAMAPSMPAPFPYPMYPWQMGMPMSPGFMFPPQYIQPPMPKAIPYMPQNASHDGMQNDGAAMDRPLPFNPPYVASEQARTPAFSPTPWVYPHPMPFFPFPMPFPPAHGQPGFPAPSTERSSANQDVALRTAGPPSLRQSASVSSLNLTHSFVAPQQPPVSSIRPSEITKKQIDMLRTTLRFWEDQLLYNRHQINEKSAEEQVKSLRRHIIQFEKNKDAQLAQEALTHPRYNRQEDSFTSEATTGNLVHSKSSDTSLIKPEPANFGLTRSQDDGPAYRRDANAEKEPKQPNVGSASISRSNDSTKPSLLPSNAALAPPFKPRAESVPSQGAASSVAAERSNTPLRSEFSREPYLVGHLKSSIDPLKARGTDYSYGRALTKDEIRARRLYWGNVPNEVKIELQKGLPKYDGKNFYPPSPGKDNNSDVPDASARPCPRANEPSGCSDDTPKYMRPVGKDEIDPKKLHSVRGKRGHRGRFFVSSKSESTPNSLEPEKPVHHGNRRFGNRGGFHGRSYDELNKSQSSNTAPTSEPSKQHPSFDDVEEEEDLIFKGRRGGKSKG